MRLTRDQVEQMAQRIIRGLLKDEVIVADDPQRAIDILAQTFSDDLAAEDRLNEEVRELLLSYSDQISQGMVNYQELFRKVKAKMARDRKMVI